MSKYLKIIVRFVLFIREIQLGFSRGANGAAARNIDKRRPVTWEFSSFSQNGEDGIIDFLSSNLLISSRTFIEIGTSNGLANNTAYLALVKKYCGLMVEGNNLHVKLSSIIYNLFNKGVRSLNLFISKDNIRIFLDETVTLSPDVFSIDIDGNDYWVMEALLENSFRPQIIVVEYNANFGPTRAVTIPYKVDFDYSKAHPSRLYFGVSIAAWIKLLKKYNYEFVTVESNGQNAFFVNNDSMSSEFLSCIEKVEFLDNNIETNMFGKNWHQRSELIADCELVEIY